MKIIHMHHDDAIDAVSDLTLDPRALPEGVLPTKVIQAGLEARMNAIEGQCSGCWQERILLNREMRRRMFPGKKALFDGFVKHMYGCPAQHESVRQFIYNHRRLV
jgi:hypothetical protein